MRIRPETASDAAAIRTVVAAAFGQDVEADLVEDIRASAGYLADMALVAEDAGSIVGHVMISDATLEASDGPRRVVMLAPLAVTPERQREGIGGQLVRAVTAVADAAGEPLVVLEGDSRYYGRFGFEHAAAHGITIPLPDWAPSEAGQVLRLASYNSTWQGRVVYPAPFEGID